MSDNKGYTDIVSDGGMDPRYQYEQEQQAKREQALFELYEAGRAQEEGRKLYEHDNDTWWNSLSQKEREDAFYAVCKRIHRGDIELNGTYRYVLYDVFGFDASMYGAGMDCGYMDIHNAIAESAELQRMHSVDRFEVIDNTGRAYVKYVDKEEMIRYNLQDENKTLKVFIDNKSWRDDT